jgi:hypothetical protein
MVLQPAVTEFQNLDRFKSQSGENSDLELSVDLSGGLASLIPVGTNAGLMALSLLIVTEVPNATAQVSTDSADAKRNGFLPPLRGWTLRHLLSSSEKLSATKALQTGTSWEAQESQMPVVQLLRTTGSRQ